MRRPREGWVYEVLLIRPNGTQLKVTRDALYNTKHVSHREAMRVMREQRNARDPGTVVRMLRLPWGTKVTDAWSDDGNTWRPMLDDSETYNATIAAVREKEATEVKRTYMPSERPSKKRCLTQRVPPLEPMPDGPRDCCVCTSQLLERERDACTECRGRFGPHLIMVHQDFCKVKAEQGEYAIELTGYLRIVCRSCRLSEGDTITLYGVRDARAGQVSVFLRHVLSVRVVTIAEHNVLVRYRNDVRRLRKKMQGMGDGTPG